MRKEAGDVSKWVDTMAYAERLVANEASASGYTEATLTQVSTARRRRTSATWGRQGGEAVRHARSLAVSDPWQGGVSGVRRAAPGAWSGGGRIPWLCAVQSREAPRHDTGPTSRQSPQKQKPWVGPPNVPPQSQAS